MTNSDDQMAQATPLPLSPRGMFFRKHAWIAFLAPLIVYMVVPYCFDTTVPGDHLSPRHAEIAATTYRSNLLWKTTAMAATAVPIGVLLAFSLHLPKFRISPLAIAVGVVGVALWVGIDAIGVERWVATQLGDEGWLGWIAGVFYPAREGVNSFELYGDQSARFWLFIIARFIGLAIIVPVVEELMLRGWLMRMVDNPQFWLVPFGEVSVRAAAIGIGFEVLIHPERLAALAWFSLVTWLMFRTKNFWDCVAAHAVTNFLLGVWVVWRGAWGLW